MIQLFEQYINESESENLDFFKKIYGNLLEKTEIITSETNFFNKDGYKKLQYGFDPNGWNSESNTLSYYWWDFIDSKLDSEIFQTNLKTFFEKTYNKKVKNFQALYVGTTKQKSKNTY